MVDYESEKRIVAYHEAGHCIMAIACGFTVLEFTITDGENGEGHVRYQMPDPITGETAKKGALVSAAGLAADMILATMGDKSREDSAFAGHFGDQERANFFMSQDEEDYTFDDYLTFAYCFLMKQWTSVDLLAKCLFEFETIDPGAFDVSQFPRLPVNWQDILHSTSTRSSPNYSEQAGDPPQEGT